MRSGIYDVGISRWVLQDARMVGQGQVRWIDCWNHRICEHGGCIKMDCMNLHMDITDGPGWVVGDSSV